LNPSHRLLELGVIGVDFYEGTTSTNSSGTSHAYSPNISANDFSSSIFGFGFS
jgi:hypothetical protein